MFSNIKLSQIMSTDLVTVKPNDTLEKVDQIFKQNEFHHIPVVDDNQELLGIIS